MSERPKCPRCGNDLPVGSPRDLCPRCLLHEGLRNGASNVSPSGGATATAGLTTSVGRALDAIAATIGSVPRVLLRDTDGGDEPPIHRPGAGDEAGSNTRYRIDGEIAHGGMGVVLQGRDPDIGRDVALKVLREDFRDNADMVRRFVEEAQIGGQLQHPGIVPIYEMGLFTDRRPYFSMKLVKGRTLAALLADRPDPAHERPRFLAIFESIAQTVAYAHARGVIHRDLKPSNVMVGSFGEVQVMDWGLAKVLPRRGVAQDAQAGKANAQDTLIATARSGCGHSDLSHAGSAMGTPSYMAPEQARGEIDRIDERADVFALGSILCEVLTGQPASTGRTSGEIQRKAALGDLADALARLDACGADAELVALAKACLASEPEDRPRSAGAVAEKVTAYLAGVQEKLRRAELERVEERGRRRLTMVAAAAVILLGLAVGGGYVWSEQQRAERRAKTARSVDEALAEAARLRGEARAAPPGEIAAWAEALSAGKRAEGLLAQGEADAPLRRRVSDLLAQLKAEQVAAAEKARRVRIDRALLSDLETVRGNRAEHVDPRRTDAEYADAFRKAGLDLDATDPDVAGKWIAARSLPVELAGYLDDWTFVRIAAGQPEAAWRRLVAAARVADPDSWRGALRSRVGSKDPAALAECRRLADDAAALEGQPPASLLLLAGQLTRTYDDLDRAGRVLEAAVRRHPDDFWLHMALADSYNGYIEFTRPEEAIRHITAAIALRPKSAIARYWLGNVLTLQYKLEEAIAEYREAIRIRPDQAEPYHGHGIALTRLGQYEEAISEYRKAIALKPRLAGAHTDLGEALCLQGKLDDADVEYREAIRLQPEKAYPRYAAAGILLRRGKLDEAAAECREAIRISPDFSDIHSQLGVILERQGKIAEADAEHHKSIRLKSPSWDTYDRFAAFMMRHSKRDEMVAVFRDAVLKKPDDASRHCHLALILKAQGKPDEALAELREAMRLKPQSVWMFGFLERALSELGRPEDVVNLRQEQVERARKLFGPAAPGTAKAMATLGLTLIKQGKSPAAERVLRECLSIREKIQPDVWTTFNARSLLGDSLLGQGKYAEAEPLIVSGYEGMKARRATIPAGGQTSLPEAAARVLRLYDAWGKTDKAAGWRAKLTPSQPAELLAVARIFYDDERFTDAARLLAEALKANPRLGDDRAAGLRYHAACFAALAATGESFQEPPPDDTGRAKLRGRALGWLKAERDAWSKFLDSGQPADRTTVVRTLRHWQDDPHLAGVRERDALARLPEVERRAWQSLWADVDALLARARGGRP